MSEVIKGDVLTKSEMKKRGVYIIAGDRGGIEFRSIHAGSLIADNLLSLGFIEHYHYNDAMVFMDLRRAFEAAMGVKWVRVDTTSGEASLSSGEAARRYDGIRHEIGVQRAATVATIIADAFEPARTLRAEINDVYRIAFEELSNAMEAVEKKLNEMLANPL
jgi:hypothetical protein